MPETIDTTAWRPNLDDLRRLYDEANALLDDLREHPHNRPSAMKGEASAWARVRCIDAAACLSHNGEVSTCVEIAGADGDANALRGYLYDQLEARGFTGLTVCIDW